MKHNPRNTGKCKICAYMKSHPGATYNKRIISGESLASIAKDFGCDVKLVGRHAGRGKDKEGNPNVPHFTRQLKAGAKVREARAGLDLLKCQEKVWNDAQEAIDISLGRKPTPATANLAVFGQCIAPQVKIIEVMAKIDDKPQVTQTNITNNYDNLSKEDLRKYIELTAKVEGSEEGTGEEKPG